jgi:hypothetical protein
VHITLRPRPIVLAAILGLAGLVVAHARPFDQSHGLLDKTLKTFVQDALVDYGALRASRADLDRYLDEVAAVPEGEFSTWPERQRLAFLINAYNAFTLELVLDHYPVKSIKEIGGWLKDPWDQPVVRLFGRAFTLNDVEHKILRVQFAEPRIHFALVCAARGCPPLRSEAYVANHLDAQLDEQARRFLATTSKNRVNDRERVVHLSPIFKWYGSDFEKQAGSVLAALNPYWPEEAAAALARGDFKIRYTDYDWSLNQSANSHRRTLP